MKIRFTVLLVAATLVGAIALTPAVAGQASAAPAAPATNTLSLNGGNFPVSIPGFGTLDSITITGFKVINGVLSAVGTAQYTPTGGTQQTTNFSASLTPTSRTCPILTLDLGAIHLDLLGLVVNTSPIHLNVTAQSGPGNLLGNLLCAVAHLLDNSGVGPLNQVAALLNGILPTGGLTL